MEQLLIVEDDIGLNIPGMPINGMRDTMLSSFGYSSIFQEILG